MKHAVINRHGIHLAAGRQAGRYLYIPRCEGDESIRACEAWIRRHDQDSTCGIVEYVIDPRVSAAARVMGKKGGRSTSPAKVAAARRNAPTGGRNPKLPA
jgi:hypothetical protein